jgi:hypothetical protein
MQPEATRHLQNERNLHLLTYTAQPESLDRQYWSRHTSRSRYQSSWVEIRPYRPCTRLERTGNQYDRVLDDGLGDVGGFELITTTVPGINHRNVGGFALDLIRETLDTVNAGAAGLVMCNNGNFAIPQIGLHITQSLDTRKVFVNTLHSE